MKSETKTGKEDVTVSRQKTVACPEIFSEVFKACFAAVSQQSECFLCNKVGRTARDIWTPVVKLSLKMLCSGIQ